MDQPNERGETPLSIAQVAGDRDSQSQDLLPYCRKVAELLQKYRYSRPTVRNDQSVDIEVTQDSKKELEIDEKEGDSSGDAVNSRTVEDIDNLIKLIQNL